MKRLTISVLLLLALIAACNRVGKPPDITVGSTTCVTCKRVIDDASLAAVALAPDGTVKTFDSAACLLKTIPKGDQWKVWFHDHESQNWIEGSKAVFVIQRQAPGAPARHTPAFVDRKHASAFYERTPGRNEIAPDYSTLRAVMSHE